MQLKASYDELSAKYEETKELYDSTQTAYNAAVTAQNELQGNYERVCAESLKKHKQSYQRCMKSRITQEMQGESQSLLMNRWSRLEKWQQMA